jgi:hypothetical protein
VTFVATVTDVATRFLTERSFDLIVAPALADFELDLASGERSVAAARAAVVAALVGAAWDDAVRSGDLALFAGLVMLPVCYYTFFFLLGFPAGADHLSATVITLLGLAVLMLSVAPALVCFWPERQPPAGQDRPDLTTSTPQV